MENSFKDCSSLKNVISFILQAKSNFEIGQKTVSVYSISFFHEIYLMEEFIPQRYRNVFLVCVPFLAE